MKNGKLNGKVAVVTGASKGIGAGIAKQLATEGAAVVVNYASSKSDADKVVDEITKGGGKAVAIQGSVAKKKRCRAPFCRARKKRLAGLMCSLTTRPSTNSMLEEITEDTISSGV